MGTGYGDPSIVGDKLYILGGTSPKMDAQEFCVCLSTADGKQLWRTPLQTTAGKFLDGWGAGPRSSPTVDGDKLYVLGTTGDLLCPERGRRQGSLARKTSSPTSAAKSRPGGTANRCSSTAINSSVRRGDADGMIALNKADGSVSLVVRRTDRRRPVTRRSSRHRR